MVDLKKLLAAAALVTVLAAPAFAHTAFMKPNDFYPAADRVVVQSAWATQFFTAAIGLGQQSFKVIGPDGGASSFIGFDVSAQDAHLEAGLPVRGTYRVTTGEVLGPITPLVSDGVGGWRPLGQGEIPPEGETTTSVQTVTVAESYVTRGVPNRTAVDAPGGRLALHPITHPNQILLSTGFQLTLMLDGAPMPNVAVVLYGAGDPETKQDHYVTTDASGNATLTFDQPGQYVVAARYRGAAPADAGVAIRSYTTTLTVDVMTALPPAPPPERPGRARRDRSRLY